jgi:hypothetical protein
MIPVFSEAQIRQMTAPRWKVWLAALLGRRIAVGDKHGSVVAYSWRGKLYVTDVRVSCKPV